MRVGRIIIPYNGARQEIMPVAKNKSRALTGSADCIPSQNANTKFEITGTIVSKTLDK